MNWLPLTPILHKLTSEEISLEQTQITQQWNEIQDSLAETNRLILAILIPLATHESSRQIDKIEVRINPTLHDLPSFEDLYFDNHQAWTEQLAESLNAISPNSSDRWVPGVIEFYQNDFHVLMLQHQLSPENDTDLIQEFVIEI